MNCNKPLPALPKSLALVENFDALPLAGKKPTEKKLQDPPGPVDGFSPEVRAFFAALDGNRGPPLMPLPLAVNRNARTASRPQAKAPPVPPSKPIYMPIPMHAPQAGKHSLTMQFSFMPPGLRPDKPALAPLINVPPRPRSDSIVSPKAASKPPLDAAPGPTQPTLNVTPSRPRAISGPSSPAKSSPGKTTTQCSGMTKAGRQCARRLKLPATHFHLDPTPVLYCYQHKVVIANPAGFYVRGAGSTDKFIIFNDYIPKYLQVNTQLALRVEMEKAVSSTDVPGYIYTFEIRDPKRPDVIQLKVGRTANLAKRLDQWDKQCSSKIHILRGWWPGTVEDDDETDFWSLLKGNIKAGVPGPFSHRVERLIHLELADLSLHTPYLNPEWPNNTSDPSPGASPASSPKKTAKETTCDCGVVHKEIFSFPRPENGRYNGMEWNLIVKPVIEKWGKFIKECYTR